jgi:hypothetical protein
MLVAAQGAETVSEGEGVMRRRQQKRRRKKTRLRLRRRCQQQKVKRWIVRISAALATLQASTRVEGK